MKPKSKRKHHKSDSSSDSDVPLVQINRSLKKNDLHRYSLEKCDFCDKVFYNKYNILVHNATHIIIPLLNQKLYKCSQCQQHFNSIESLEWHSINSHSYISHNKDYLPKILQSFVKREPMMVLKKEPLSNNFKVNRESNVEKANEQEPMVVLKNELLSNNLKVNGKSNVEKANEQDEIPDILQSMVLKEPVTVLTKLDHPIIKENENILQSLVKKHPITLLKKEWFQFDNDEIEDGITISDSDDENDDVESIDIKDEMIEGVSIDNDSHSSKNPKIKDRIRFEDDEIDLNDIDQCTDAASQMNGTVVKIGDNLSNIRKNAIIIGNKPSSNDCNAEVVHNDELRKPGLFRCKKCSKMFPNRYEAIIHETSHLRIRRRLPFICRYCDWYVATHPVGLVHHQKTKHQNLIGSRPKTIKKCNECRLSYTSTKRHRENYHHEYKCSYCDMIFETSDELLVHKSEHSRIEVDKDGLKVTWKIKTVKVCQFCFHWFKDRKNLKYEHVQTYSKSGERFACERCEKVFFELLVVKMWVKRRDPLRQVEKDMFDVRKPKKPKTNMDRLKNVQMRLKKLKLLNKF